MHIYLTEGFSGEPVRVMVNGTQVLDRADVRTDYSAGLAASASADVQGPATVVVELPGRRLRAEHATQARDDLALLVRVGEDGLSVEEATEPVRFM
jgi:hypothetical protein